MDTWASLTYDPGMSASLSCPLALRAGIAVTALLALGVAGGSAETAAGSPAGPAAAARYSLSATTRCLEARGASVKPVRPLDSQLRQLRDLAQRTSREARLGRQSVGLAFTQSEANAELLVELLAVPNNAYRVVQRRNVVLMYKLGSRAALADTVECLRS